MNKISLDRKGMLAGCTAACGLQDSDRYCTLCCAVAGAGGTWCSWHNPGHRQVSVCTQQRSSAVITRHFCHLQMSHGAERRVSAEPNSVWLCVDGLEKHLLENVDINAPTFMGVMVPLLLYADDLYADV